MVIGEEGRGDESESRRQGFSSSSSEVKEDDDSESRKIPPCKATVVRYCAAILTMSSTPESSLSSLSSKYLSS